ncbi:MULTISPECIES: MarR family winged helix-turn-helix transcriptional regulator [unclassified Frondihabitans]|uniref:MarR family winged helix-turn-helix transcriptional regulator n=1 Tax=unclassified Frondihabitans TaxID=2626248 RepID=UPI000FAAE649|nr:MULTISPECIES: MarR family winged helix-turn-helix transcriptional regulator [unclassified Frondihabitans]RPE77932.1 DNA-binding MarR family transcriptional regulator [Frondihabitans sp. PhB153]RPF08212.1 DNA-binding MarR family transcriptional regulator [Frondihabitans sp. PhB161]
MNDEAVTPPLYDFDPATPSGAVIQALYALQDAEALHRCRLRDHFGIGANDLSAIEYIARLENVGRTPRPRDVTHMLGVTSAATTILLNRLMTRGFVTRQPDPEDGRGQLLGLTPVARAMLQDAAGTSQHALRMKLSTITAREAQRVVSLLDAVTLSLDKGAPVAKPLNDIDPAMSVV